jgi:flagellar FliL protein
MSNETTEQAAEAPKGGKKIFLALAVTIGLLVGGGGGVFVAGPLLANRAVAPAQEHGDAEAEAGDHDDEAGARPVSAETHGKKGGKGDTAPRPMHLIENVVLNPAQSGGTRFLMLTLALEVKDAAVLEAMKTRDAEVRDVVLSTLGSKTVEELANTAARDALKEELRKSIGGLFSKGSVTRVYLPQFVIQ